MSKVIVFLLAFGLMLPIAQSNALPQKLACKEDAGMSPFDANENKINCLLSQHRLLTDKEIAFLIENYYEPDELYKLKLISLEQKQALGADRL
jgi:hypothetical protein